MNVFVILSLFVGLALGSPIGQVGEEVTTTVVPDLLRSDIQADEVEVTTVVVEILADEAVTSATERARQGENESEEEEEDEATTVSSGGGAGSSSSGSSSSSASSASRVRPAPAIPQPFANSSNFLAEYEFSQQFSLGPKDESVPLAGAPAATNNKVVPQAAAAAASAAAPASPVAQPAAAAEAPAAAPASSPTAGVPLTANSANSVPTIVAAGEDEDDAESDEVTEAPSASVAAVAASAARQQPPQQPIEELPPMVQKVTTVKRIQEESDSDNEISNDDITTVRSFASEYEYTVQQLGNNVPS